MSPEVSLNLSEIPRGEQLARRTVALSRRAIINTYPIFSDPEFGAVLPRPNDIRILPLGEIQDLEKNDVDAENNPVYQALKILGVPNDTLSGIYHEIYSGNPIYFPEYESKPNLYIAEEFMQYMLSPNEPVRVSTARALGLTLIQLSLANAPIDREFPLQSEWREILRDHTFNMIDKTGQEMEADQPSIARARSLIGKHINPDSAIISHGAAVRLYLGNDAKTPVYSAGNVLNQGLVRYLARSVYPVFTDHMREAFGYKPTQDIEETDPEKFSKSIVENMGWWNIPTGDKTVVDRKSLINAYLESLIPLYYRSSGRAIDSSKLLDPDDPQAKFQVKTRSDYDYGNERETDREDSVIEAYLESIIAPFFSSLEDTVKTKGIVKPNESNPELELISISEEEGEETESLTDNWAYPV